MTRRDRRLIAKVLDGSGLPFHWEPPHELVVAKEHEDRVDQLVEAVEFAAHLLSVPPENDDCQIAYRLSGWADSAIRLLEDALEDLGTPFEWDGGEVIVSKQAERVVDLLTNVLQPSPTPNQ